MYLQKSMVADQPGYSGFNILSMSEDPNETGNTLLCYLSLFLQRLFGKAARGFGRILCKVLVKKSRSSLDRCTVCCDKAKMMIKTVYLKHQPINPSIN